MPTKEAPPMDGCGCCVRDVSRCHPGTTNIHAAPKKRELRVTGLTLRISELAPPRLLVTLLRRSANGNSYKTNRPGQLPLRYGRFADASSLRRHHFAEHNRFTGRWRPLPALLRPIGAAERGKLPPGRLAEPLHYRRNPNPDRNLFSSIRHTGLVSSGIRIRRCRRRGIFRFTRFPE